MVYGMIEIFLNISENSWIVRIYTRKWNEQRLRSIAVCEVFSRNDKYATSKPH